MSKKTLRIVLPTLALLGGLIAGALASQPSPALAQGTDGQCVAANTESVTGCTAPIDCVQLGPCRWICP